MPMIGPDIRIVVVTNGNYFSKIILEDLLLSYTKNVVGVVLVQGDYKGRTGLKALWGVGRQTALPYTLYKVIQFVLFSFAQKLTPRSWLKVDAMVRDLGLESMHAVRVNAPDVVKWVQQREPDLLISVSCPQRIRAKLLRVPRIAAINIHSSLLPRYAGLAPYYWVLVEGETETGVSVHYMSERFDEGNIIVQKSLHIPPRVSAFILFKHLALLGKEALMEAIPLVLSGYPGIPQDLSRRSYYSHPTWASYRNLKRRGYVIARWRELIAAIREAGGEAPRELTQGGER